MYSQDVVGKGSPALTSRDSISLVYAAPVFKPTKWNSSLYNGKHLSFLKPSIFPGFNCFRNFQF